VAGSLVAEECPCGGGLSLALVDVGAVCDTPDEGPDRAIHRPHVNRVHTLNVVHLRLVPEDRRERSREKRRLEVLAGAQRLVDREGLDSLTMGALAEELDCAVGTLYSYFTSKADLVAGLQGQAVAVLRSSLHRGADRWETLLGGEDLPDDLAALTRLAAFGAFWAAASVVFPDEFALQAQLLVASPSVGGSSSGATTDDGRRLGIIDDLVATPRDWCDEAVGMGALTAGDNATRALVWIASMNAVLGMDALAPLDRHRFRPSHLHRLLTRSLLVGWGAAPESVEVAEAHVERLAAAGPMAPAPDGPPEA